MNTTFQYQSTFEEEIDWEYSQILLMGNIMVLYNPDISSLTSFLTNWEEIGQPEELGNPEDPLVMVTVIGHIEDIKHLPEQLTIGKVLIIEPKILRKPSHNSITIHLKQ